MGQFDKDFFYCFTMGNFFGNIFYAFELKQRKIIAETDQASPSCQYSMINYLGHCTAVTHLAHYHTYN
jgi:hypothetical protein